jgi:hypothetical protein
MSLSHMRLASSGKVSMVRFPDRLLKCVGVTGEKALEISDPFIREFCRKEDCANSGYDNNPISVASSHRFIRIAGDVRIA